MKRYIAPLMAVGLLASCTSDKETARVKIAEPTFSVITGSATVDITDETCQEVYDKVDDKTPAPIVVTIPNLLPTAAEAESVVSEVVRQHQPEIIGGYVVATCSLQLYRDMNANNIDFRSSFEMSLGATQQSPDSDTYTLSAFSIRQAD